MSYTKSEIHLDKQGMLLETDDSSQDSITTDTIEKSKRM